MTKLLDVRPASLDALFRAGNTFTCILTWPAGSLAGRTFTAQLDAAALAVGIVGDVMTVTVTAAQTLAAGKPGVFTLTETTGGTSQVLIAGRWRASTAPSASSSSTVTVTVGAATVQVSGQLVSLLVAADPTEVDLDTVGDITTLALLNTIGRRAVIHTSGQYYFSVYGTSTGQTLVQNQLCLYPLELSPGTIDRVGVHVSTGAASGVIRLGVYADNGGLPLNLIAEATNAIGTYPLDASTTGTKEAGISAVIPKGGLGYLALCAQGAGTIVIRGGSVNATGVPVPLGTGAPADDDTARLCRIQSGVTGALPSSLTLGSANSQRARIFFRYA